MGEVKPNIGILMLKPTILRHNFSQISPKSHNEPSDIGRPKIGMNVPVGISNHL